MAVRNPAISQDHAPGKGANCNNALSSRGDVLQYCPGCFLYLTSLVCCYFNTSQLWNYGVITV